MPKGYYKKKEKKALTKAEAKDVRKIVKYQIKSQLAPEPKYHSKNVLASAGNLVTNGTAPLFVDLTDIAQSNPNASDSTRIGDQVKLQRLQVRYLIEALSTYTSGANRVVIFQWHLDNNLTAPTTALLFMNGVSGTLDSTSPWNEDSKKSDYFTVLYDRTHVNVASADNDLIYRDIKVRTKYAKKTIEFTSGSVFGNDHIFIVFIADKANAGTNACTYNFASRAHFLDV